MNEYTFSQVVGRSVINEAQDLARKLRVDTSDPEKISSMLEEHKQQVELIKRLLTTTSASKDLPRIPITEALHSADASILFPKAISDVLLRPREPMMIGQQYLAKTIQVDNVRSLEFPVMGAIRAFDMSETQEYPEQSAAFAQHFTEVKVNKVGLRIDIAEEVIRDSMWDVLGLYIEAAGFAMMRHKEEKIFNTALDFGHVVYDNNVNDINFWTHGMGADGNYNYTVTFDDLLDALGALVAHEYVPTDIIMHPLGWVVWAKDPVLRAQFLTGGQIGQTVWSSLPQFDQSINMPWNINYVVTPFTNISLNTRLSGHSGDASKKYANPSSLPNAHLTDIIIIDRNSAIVVLQRDPMEMDNFEEWRRDTRAIKVRERYGVAALNQGRSISLIKNIRLDTNYAPIMTIRTISPS
jgi:hypothetical protein